MKPTIVALVIVSVLPALALGQQPPPKELKVPIPSPNYRGVPDPNAPADPQSLANSKWFEVFQDPVLQDLIRTALVHNYDLRAAVARIDDARAQYGITRSERFPQFGASAHLVTQAQSRDGSFTIPEPVKTKRTFGNVLLNLFDFELDIWGRVKKQTEAAKHDVLATEEARKAVITTLVSDVATSYFNLRELDFELEVAQRTLRSRQESLRIISLRQQRGVANMLELRQAEELVYEASSTIPDLERAIEQQENFISFLLGKNPDRVRRGLSLTEHLLPPTVPSGLPSDLLERRPDIQAAEEGLIAANARIDVAKKAYFPRISLTGVLGFESTSLSDLFKASRSVWAFGPSLTQPIFTAGRLKNNVRLTQAQKDLFLINYEKTIQKAFREVSDSLIAYRKVREVRGQRELLVETLRDRARLAYLRYNGGYSNLLEALDADRNLFDAELSLAQSRRDELLSVVLLYKSLGGGWQ